jgi:hypothetical protein
VRKSARVNREFQLTRRHGKRGHCVEEEAWPACAPTRWGQALCALVRSRAFVGPEQHPYVPFVEELASRRESPLHDRYASLQPSVRQDLAPPTVFDRPFFPFQEARGETRAVAIVRGDRQSQPCLTSATNGPRSRQWPSACQINTAGDEGDAHPVRFTRPFVEQRYCQ